MSFRLQYASNLFVDLHTQKYATLVKPVGSTLALIGNIGKPHDVKTYHFLNYCSRNWDRVVWVSGTHELSKAHTAREGFQSVKALGKEFQNVRCLDSEEEVFHPENTILFGIPPESPLLRQRSYTSNLRHAALRTVFWTMTHPMANLIFLSSTGPEKNLLPIEGNRLEAPVSLWLTGNSKTNRLSTDSKGQLFAGNSCFQSASVLLKYASYSPTAFLEIVSPGVSLLAAKESLQLA